MSFVWLLAVPLAVAAGYVVFEVLRVVPRSNEDFIFC